MYRIAFDPSLPVVAASPFTAAGRKFASGDSVDWRALGIDERTLFDWWQAMIVVHPLETIVEMPGVADAKTAEVLSSRERRGRKRKLSVDELSDDELERLTRPE